MGLQITIENVRSFHGHYSVPLRDLTILVGENSTGKTTFLSVLAALAHRERFPDRPPFNEAPFNLGNFDTISSRKPDGRHTEGSFSIGFRHDTPRGSVDALATYVGRDGQVQLKSFETHSARGAIHLRYDDAEVRGDVDLENSDGVSHYSFRSDLAWTADERALPSLYLLLPLLRADSTDVADALSKRFPEVVQVWSQGTNALDAVVSLAPIRSKPKRTYDQVDSPFVPEGDHIPLRLSRILRGTRARLERRKLRTAINLFGADSGLFSNVRIHRLGFTASAPFEILVEVGGQQINITDVGYGVSQVLPIIAESALVTKAMVLLQQPEVHLHPRAQAALGSFLARITKTTHVVVETHSDYLIDRLRQEIAKGTITPERVLILYFERRHGVSQVFPIELDAAGNLLNPPASYREFFLQEELRIFNGGAA